MATLDAIRHDTLVLSGPDERSISLTVIEQLELFRGRHGHPWRGAGIGFLLGAVGGGVGFYAYCADTPDCNTGGVTAAGAAIAAAGGALIGAGIGALIRTDSWEEVPLDGLRVTLAPGGEGPGIGVGAALRF